MSAHLLTNLTLIDLQYLGLRRNKIRFFAKDAFLNLHSLEKLEISNEVMVNLTNLAESLQNSLSLERFYKISLLRSGWNILPPDMFQFSQGSKIDEIRLSENKLKSIQGQLFKELKYLRHLVLNGNMITDIHLVGLCNIEISHLGDNKLEEVPNFCSKDANVVNCFQNIRILLLNKNKIKMINNLGCLAKLETLSLTENIIETIYSDTFFGLTSLHTLELERSEKKLRKIQDKALRSASISYLSLRGNRINFASSSVCNITDVFAYLPNVTHLDVAQNILPKQIADRGQMFRFVKKVKEIYLDDTGLIYFPTEIVDNFPYLEKLILSRNSIHNLDNEYNKFGNLRSLQWLDLSMNLINIIGESSFPKSFLKSLKTINLSQNPYNCICDNMWFVNWLRESQKKINIISYPSNYKCAQPQYISGKLLNDYKPTVSTCTPWNPLFTLAISLSIFGFVVFLSIFIVIKCQVNIKNYLYLLRVNRRRKQGYLPIENSDDFVFHAFVVYCDDDRQWVHTEFLKKIEDEEGMKICIHHRDFEVGETISGNVDKYLRQSWKVVVIMSNNFAKNEWCQWEVDIVQERRRRQGRDVFVLIMLQNITSKYMTSPLRTLLDSTPHLRYKQGIGNDMFWKAVTECLRKPIGCPPIAVL